MHSTLRRFRPSAGTLLSCLAAGSAAFLGAGAAAMEEKPSDAQDLQACEQKLCTMILQKEPAGEDLACPLAKTWPKTTLEGGEGKLVKWGYGDARCTVSLNIERANLIGALTQPRYSLEVPEHNVRCDVETGGEVKKVRIRLAPKIDFKDGRAEKVWINLKDMTGPTSIKATVWTAASLEDSLGIFHKSMIKSINKFMYRRCAERYGPGAKAGQEARAKGDAVKTKPQPSAGAAEATAASK
jgi:hypothetical protein